MSTAHTPTVGVVYNFVFSSGHDAFNGIYRLTKLSTYDQYVTDGGDLLADFYTPNSLTQSDLDNDLKTIQASRIMQLTPPDATATDTSGIRYAPLCFLETTPDHNVQKYYAFGLITNVGITANPADLDYVRASIIEHLEAALGITPDPKYVTLNETWLTDAQYAEIVAARDTAKMKVLNYYSENQRLQANQRELQTLLKNYEQDIIQQQQQVEQLTTILQDVPLTTITFEANTGTGTMAEVQRYGQASYTLPECTFTPPAGMVFNAWCDDAMGQGTFLQAAGSAINLGDYPNQLTIYATWKANASAVTSSTS